MKPGYKQTEVGVIPDEWEVKTIDQVGFVTSGKRLPLGTSLVAGTTPHPYVRVTDMRPGTVDTSDIKYVPESAFPAIKRYRIYCNDIFISVAGSLGIVGKVPTELDGANLTENADRITNITCSQNYLLYVLMSPLIQNTIDSLQTVGAQPKLALTRIRKFAIPHPSLPEQRAIAEVLSDVDALLGALDRLIAKKRDLKQAAMQQLLTGQTRLSGFAPTKQSLHKTAVGAFPHDWLLRQLSEIVDQSRGIRYGIVQPGTYDAGGRLMIRGQDYSKGWVEPGEMFRVSAPIEERYKNARVTTGDLIITIVGAGTGHVEVIPPWLNGANLTQTTARIAVEPNGADSVFVKYMLQTSVGTGQVKNFIKGAAQPGLNCGDIEKFYVPLPPTRLEQTAIAEVLSNMDAELVALEQRRDKTRTRKQGMMQELLTGRTRLFP